MKKAILNIDAIALQDSIEKTQIEIMKLQKKLDELKFRLLKASYMEIVEGQE